MTIEVDGCKQVIEIERLHMEEDTAKQLHFDDYSLIDYNRAGIPLIEIVTKPTIRSGAAAAAYLEKLRQIFLFTEVSDAKMEEGSMRCDVNISIRPFGSDKFGTRTEIKNLNSISNVQKAIEFEVSRQEKVLISGGEVLQETRRYDEDKKETVVMRESRVARYINEYNIPKTDALILVQTKEISDFFDETVKYTNYYKIACNWLLGEVQAYLNKSNLIILTMNSFFWAGRV